MQDQLSQKQREIEWSVAARPLPGQEVSGDRHLIKWLDHRILLAVIDGVGHGEEAATAARMAVEILENHASEPLIALVKRCHEALLETRGVVLTVAAFNLEENTLTWLGVGNVEGLLVRADAGASYPRESVLLRSGLVGYQLPALQASVIPVAAGDLLVLATDGIQTAFDQAISMTESPRQLADKILSRHFKGNDDGLVLVARYLGGQHE
jgi:phosphoserine phosphatase RsbX